MSTAQRCATFVVAVLAVVAGGSSVKRAEGGAPHVVSLPAGAAGLAAVADEDASYTRETIYDYLDGGAEVYLAYGMVSCRSRRYEGATGAVVLDLFDMGSASGAFGVFTHDQDGEEVGVGQGALLRAGWLSAWYGRFFISISAEGDAAALRLPMLALGRAVAAALGPAGAVPALVGALPAAGRVERSVRFLCDPLPLRAHLDLGEGNPLRLGPGTFAALARYRRGAGAAVVLVVEYPDGAAAIEVERGVRAVTAGRGVVVRREGARLAVATGDAAELQATLVGEALGAPVAGASEGRSR